MKTTFTLFVLMLGSFSAFSQFLINEAFINVPGADNGGEFIEIKSVSGNAEALSVPGVSSIWFIVIDGDGSVAGVVDKAVDLGSYSTGTNGLLLLRDANTILNPNPSAQTSVISLPAPSALFDPDLENGSTTLLLVDCDGIQGCTGFTAGQDWDTDNNGIIDVPLGSGATVMDAIGIPDGGPGTGNHSYAAQYGGIDFQYLGFTPGAIFRAANNEQLIGISVNFTDTPPGPFTFNPSFMMLPNGTVISDIETDPDYLTPGLANVFYNLLLAAELLNFEGHLENNLPSLEWELAPETAYDEIKLLRSDDAKSWKTISSFPNQENDLRFSFQDKQAQSGLNYYRLIIESPSDEDSWSEILAIRKSSTSSIRLWPTVGDGRINLDGGTVLQESVGIQVFQTDGKVMTPIQEFDPSQGVSVDFSHLPSGSYYLSFLGYGISEVLPFSIR